TRAYASAHSTTSLWESELCITAKSIVERQRWVIHVIPTIPTCPVRSKSRHSTNARVYEYLEQVSKTGPGGRSENLDGQWSRRASRKKATKPIVSHCNHSLRAGWWFTSESADPGEIVPLCGAFAAGSAREAV